MISTSSVVIRSLVTDGKLRAAEAVDRLLDAGDHGGVRDCEVSCPECGSPFWRSFPGRWNTCSDPCQIAWNTAIMDLDSGATILKVCDLTPERTAELLTDAGLEVEGSGKVMPS